MLVQYRDPIVRYNLHGREIVLNFSHDLPYARDWMPLVSENLSRLTSFIRSSFGGLCMIDIGANIGDSFALAGGLKEDHYLLIEGDDHYFDLLTRNTSSAPNVVRVKALLSDKPSVEKDQLLLTSGTARIVHNPEAAEVHYRTLDEIVSSHPEFQASNLLKSDVDGYDFRVLRGSLKFVARSHPVIFFELHPRLLTLAGEDSQTMFPELKSLGYSKLIVYDIQGFLLGQIDTSDRELIRDLSTYATCKDDYCFDICCFHDSAGEAREKFLAMERAFYLGYYHPD
jgi:FkbM family methyltransferase